VPAAATIVSRGFSRGYLATMAARHRGMHSETCLQIIGITRRGVGDLPVGLCWQRGATPAATRTEFRTRPERRTARGTDIGIFRQIQISNPARRNA
jgi:hypothetical protein